MKRFFLNIAAALILMLAPVQAGTFFVTAARAEAPAAGMSMAQAAKVFDEMAHQRDIAFRYVADGCFARAQLMVVRMDKKGITAGKVWSLPANGSELQVKTPLAKGGMVKWKYHVAPVISVNINGKAEYRVIDPSMFKRLVTVAEWAGAQKNTHSKNGATVRITKVGEAPALQNGKRSAGTGYWLGADPAEGKTPHAIKTMKQFKALEPAGSSPLPPSGSRRSGTEGRTGATSIPQRMLATNPGYEEEEELTSAGSQAVEWSPEPSVQIPLLNTDLRAGAFAFNQ